MKKVNILTVIGMLSTGLLAWAQIELIDYSTVQPPQTYTNYLLMTIPQVATNATVTIVTTNSIVGDSLPTAALKINSDFDWLATNDAAGASNAVLFYGGTLYQPIGNYQPASLNLTNWSALTTNSLQTSASNVVINYGGTLYQPVSLNLTGWSLLSTSLLAGAGSGTSSNAIANLNGLGTNTTLINAATITSSNLSALGLSYFSNTNLIITFTNYYTTNYSSTISMAYWIYGNSCYSFTGFTMTNGGAGQFTNLLTSTLCGAVNNAYSMGYNSTSNEWIIYLNGSLLGWLTNTISSSPTNGMTTPYIYTPGGGLLGAAYGNNPSLTFNTAVAIVQTNAYNLIESVTNISQSLIPIMTASNAPSGLATDLNDYEGTNVIAWQGFGSPSYNRWTSAQGSTNSWIEYQFASAQTCGYSIQDIVLQTNSTISLQYSNSAWSTVASKNYVGGYIDTNFTLSFSPVTSANWRWLIQSVYYPPSPTVYSQAYNIQLKTPYYNLQTNGIQINGVNGVSINTAPVATNALTVGGNLQVTGPSFFNGAVTANGSVSANTAYLTTNLSQVTPSLECYDIADSGNVDAASFSISGQPINFGAIPAITNSTIQHYFTTNCGSIATNFNGLYSFNSNGLSGIGTPLAFWTNNSSGWYLIVSPFGSFFQTNSSIPYDYEGNFENVTFPGFVKLGNPLGLWPYYAGYLWPYYGFPFYQIGDMPYVTAVVSTNPVTYTGNFTGGTFTGNGSGLTNLVPNIGFTNNTTLPYGSTPTVTNFGVIGGVAYFSIGVPQGPPATNAAYPTPIYTLLDTNPIVFTGSNYLGEFTNVYGYKLNLPVLGVASQSPTTQSNEIENLYASTDNTNWWYVSNNPCLISGPVYLSISGQSATNAGEVILTSAANFTYLGFTNDLSGQITLVADGGSGNTALNYETAQAMIYNAVANGWASVTNGLLYAPYGTNVCQLQANTVVYSKGLSMTSSGTNWVISLQTTNQASGGILVGSTNLSLTSAGFGVFNAGFTVTTNSGIVSYTIPKVNCSANYEFFQIASVANSGMTVWPKLTLNSGVYYPSNTWNLFSITNGMANGGHWEGDSNGAALVEVKMSNNVPVIYWLGP